MQLLFCVLLMFPCILAADVKSIHCPDETECEFGQTCCPAPLSDDVFECCDLSDEAQENKKLIFGIYSPLVVNATVKKDCENGTLCADDKCCPTLIEAVCCESQQNCCPQSSHCCGNTTNWCCPTKTRCHVTYGYCLAGASTLSTAFASLILMFVITTSKYLS